MLMSKSEYARHRGVSRQTVYDWVAKGEVVLSGNKIDVEATERNMQNEQKNRIYPANWK
jgi:transposase